ncbi:MAG: hypothetical protein AVDCRST_MAG43-1748 [uncultured Thermomicrobiales bacterium]|uniref:TolB protein, periplasmic protein involved in the tonb-independent uptake of group A colicins n=1 Tax=uncultured Thermomicrobiales bacterium TaxID=1645740 RepID=A0A6J4UTV4_9BACT|nr:MAG: hypothetical protein AVDCRST_MAG43-1748 [uncultured Thermomicrobiales bacterium]
MNLLQRAGLIAMVLALAFGSNAARGTMPQGCAMPGTRLLVDAPRDGTGPASSLLLIDPAIGRAHRVPIPNPRTVTPVQRTGVVIVGDASGRDHLVLLADGGSTPVSGAVRAAIKTTESATAGFSTSRWVTLRTYDAAGMRLRIIDRERDRVVVDTMFRRRIEIAATATSADGRSVAHLQANNMASELTLFDAETGRRKALRIPHDASLAAYAISLTFSPDGSCLAVSMTRDTQLPESWVIDLRQPSLPATAIGAVFVLAWTTLPWAPVPVQT